MILFLAALGTAFSADLNETSKVPEVSVCKDNLENSQNGELMPMHLQTLHRAA